MLGLQLLILLDYILLIPKVGVGFLGRGDVRSQQWCEAQRLVSNGSCCSRWGKIPKSHECRLEYPCIYTPEI